MAHPPSPHGSGRLHRVLPVLVSALPLALLWGCDSAPEPYTRQDPTTFTLPPAVDGDWERCLWIDFGRRDRRSEGAVAVSSTFSYQEAAWLGGMVRNGFTEDLYHPYLQTFVEGEDATFLLGLQPAPVYRVSVTLGDVASARGPMNVTLNGEPALTGVSTRAKEFVTFTREIDGGAGELRLHLEATGCGSFSIGGLAVYRPRPADSAGETTGPILRPLFPAIPAFFSPAEMDEVPPPSPEQLQQTLRRLCDYFVSHGPGEGGFSYRGAWYESSFPVRTLLAGAALLDRPDYAETARRCLDRFVAEQRADGTWSSNYFGRGGCVLAMQMVGAGHSANLADVGAMALSLSLALPGADAARGSAYRKAAETYAREVVLPNQAGDGSFPNLLYRGQDYRYPYSVATGIQAANLAALHGLTGDETYRTAAVRAGLFLAAHVIDNGAIQFYPHDRAEPVVLDATQMGDIFYVVEGMLWATHCAEGRDRAVLETALDRVFTGSRGILACQTHREWWEPQKGGEQGKRCGALYLWNLYRAPVADPDHRAPMILRSLASLDSEPTTAHYGVFNIPEFPGGHDAMVATGFTGLGVATAIDPRVFFALATPGS